MTGLANARVFVTGANGLIGSHLLRRLHQEGAEVAILLRPNSSTTIIDDVLPHAEICTGTVSDHRVIRQFLDRFRPEIVYHLAAYTGVSRDLGKTEEALATNFHGTVNLLSALEHSDVGMIVTSGSCEEYGSAEPPFHEELSPRPVSPYSASKAAMTVWCQMVSRMVGLPICVVRPFLCYGPGQSLNRPLPQAICTALDGRDFATTKGEQTRDLVHVTDMVEGYIRAGTTRAAAGEIINLGSGTETRIRDVFERIFTISGSTGKLLLGALPDRSAEMWRVVSSTEKAQRILGWKPVIDLDKGLANTIAWYDEHRLGPAEVALQG